MKRLIMMVALVALWCALWQRVSIANVLSGTTLAVAIFASGLGPAGRGGVRLVPLLKLLWVVVVDLVVSTIAVAREVIVPEDTTDETVIVVEIAPIGRQHLLLLVVAVTLTPGTAVVDVERDSGRLHIHLLHRDQADAVTEHVHELTRLAADALEAA